MNLIVFLVTFSVFLVNAKHLPTYIIPCKRNDHNFKACAIKHATEALPHILQGDKEFKTPVLAPFKISRISVSPSDQLSFELKDVVLTGLENVVIDDLDFDLEKKHIRVLLSFKWINIQGSYEVDGRILVLPIKGSGPANISCENLVVDYAFDYKLMKKADGKEYIDPDITAVLSYTVSKNYFYFGNLFNGDKTLGDRTNQFLNENGMELNKDLSPAISKTINIIASGLFKQILPQVPVTEILL